MSLCMALTIDRYNDGGAMLAFWRIDGKDFWNRNHYKYLILMHRFIAGEWNKKNKIENLTLYLVVNSLART